MGEGLFCGFKILGKIRGSLILTVAGGLPVVALRGKGMFCILKFYGTRVCRGFDGRWGVLPRPCTGRFVEVGKGGKSRLVVEA
jgi:hypothetical protein